ncbi:DUF2461 family protein [Pseudarthrobacter albicanus]|uniref:DUF2461 family protein n=1 Tax=Pseudarthrobacter albicanus TaxID=2823873 RepID=UPI001BA4ABAE|nr:DUF2461 family protein [Pseudarthrobacter albicanus]
MDTFAGIPDAAVQFYAELEHNNNRDCWLEHKAVYDAAVKDPLTQLLAQLEPRFGDPRLFRPNRDIRFSPDQSPYKTAQGAFLAHKEGTGFYLQLGADGLLNSMPSRNPSFPRTRQLLGCLELGSSDLRENLTRPTCFHLGYSRPMLSTRRFICPRPVSGREGSQARA